MSWPERIITLPVAEKAQLMKTDPDRYWAQVWAERQDEARQYVAAEVDRIATQRRGRVRTAFWRTWFLRYFFGPDGAPADTTTRGCQR